MSSKFDSNGDEPAEAREQGLDTVPEFVREALSESPSDEPARDAASIVRLPELLAPLAISAASRARLLGAVEALPLRYAPFYDRLCGMWELSESAVVEILARSNDPRAWQKPPLPGLELLTIPRPHGSGGEAYLARFAAGMRFPAHRHDGHEEVLLLEGSYADASGIVYRSGDVHRMEAGSLHHFDVLPDEPCVAAALHHGIEFSSLWLRLLAKFFG